MPVLPRLLSLVTGDRGADRAVPPSGFTSWLTLGAAAAMAFLAVFALAFSAATGRLADRWSEELARTSTLRISAPAEEMAAQTAAALRVLGQTPGVAEAHALTAEEQEALLAPWFGPDLPLDSLPLPQLVEIVEEGEGFDPAGLRARLVAEVPGAVLDDHARWREPLVAAAGRLRLLATLSTLLIGAALVAMVTLAVQSSLAANAQIIRVLRLVGARDVYIARAFVRRFTMRALLGALGGTVLGTAALLILPRSDVAGGFLTGLGFAGASWLLPLTIPPVAAIAAFWASRSAALTRLRAES
ncbi:cell division protein FtsX [Pseudoroseicyclus sp. CXY001]|uniref:cell division protein FtsX n=1 Tax=Pseudoroseicyclus sp. CXY001 TaxID=3242492 RepID=UPI00358DACD0